RRRLGPTRRSCCRYWAWRPTAATARACSATSSWRRPRLREWCSVAEQERQGVSYTFRVRYAETDAMGIVHHTNYIIWMEMGRTEFMRAHGFTYRELEEMGVLLPVIEVNVRYRQPAYYDDELRITTWVEELSRVRLKLGYSIARTSDEVLLTE